MYINRIEKLLNTAEADAVYITSPENMRYYSGFSGGEGALIMQKDKRLLCTDSRYVLQATEEAPDFTVIDTAKAKVTDCLAGAGVTTVAFEEEHVSAKAYRALCKALPHCEWLGADALFLRQRAIKDNGELALIRRAAKLADQAFLHVLPLIKPGAKERDIALELDWFMRRHGAEGPSFPFICASGHRSAMPHGVASNKRLAPGDFVTMDFGCFYQGYASDMTRTVVLGPATAEQKKIYETVLQAQTAALSLLKPGLSGKEADAAARDIITAAGYGDYFGHGLGHGTGLVIHEQPTLSPRSDSVLTPGMVVTVEPGIYVENLGGVRIEDLVVITETGYENLTRAEKMFLEL